MSKFYIEVDSENKPVGNPVDEVSARAIGYFKDGLKQNIVPERFKPFQLTRKLPIAWNEEWAVDGELRFLNGFWYRHYEARLKTPDEIASYRSSVESEFKARFPDWNSWTFNTISGQMSPPVHPEPGLVNPQWDEESKTWSAGPTE